MLGIAGSLAVVAAFTTRLRSTVDLDIVRGDLIGAVTEATQPAHVSVWLPGPGQRAQQTQDPASPRHRTA